MLTPKDIEKYANSMRKAGIRTLKLGDVEINLSDTSPVARRRRATSQPDPVLPEPDPDTLLFWSSSAAPEASPEKGDA